MAEEIERKFLIKGDFKSHVSKKIEIVQGYLSSVPERSVRVRIKNDKGFLTIKGIGNETGVSRYEWEKEIKLRDARELLKICEPGVIEKTRFLVEEGDHTFEIDVFHRENEGLIIAEIELESEEEEFVKPDWLGREVTGEEKYYNVMLVANPYKNWS
jgi:adenylate cyclase